MVLLNLITDIDIQLLLAVNKANSEFWDTFFTFFSSKEIWFPFYALLLYVVIRKYKINGLWVFLFMVLGVVLSDQISGLIKDLVQRFRPTHEPALEGLLNMPIGKRGMYGFVSSHAANTWMLTILVGLLSKSKRIWISLAFWATLTCYSRIYLAVHYPGDVIAGGVLGGLIGWFVYWLIALFDNRFLRKKIEHAKRWKSKYSSPVVLALVLITATLLIVANLSN